MTAVTDNISSAAPRLAVVVVAAGGSRRMGGSLEKQFREFGRTTVLATCVSAFLKHADTGQVVIVTAAGRQDAARTALGELGNDQRVVLVDGGARRQDSVLAGLVAAQEAICPLWRCMMRRDPVCHSR